MSCTIKRILQFNEAIVYGPIQVFNLSDIDITSNCMYSWSSDGVCWTTWTDYAHYQSICCNIEDQFYLRVLLLDSFSRISVNGLFTTCYNICLDSSSPFLETFCDSENLFRPYQNLDCALQLQQQLADSVICMLGLPIYYFRVAPDVQTADYTFKEYVLHNVESVKQLSLMIPDGTMPSSNPKFTALDFDWQVDWDVEIGKTQFATAFGDLAFPKARDFIYIPSMKRMWSVNAAYDEKNEGLMWRSTTWKLALIKYEDATNISWGDDVQDLIDNLHLQNYQDTFGNKEEKEQERQIGSLPVTSPDHAATNLCNIEMQDAVRQAYTKDGVSVIDYQYNHRSNIVARSIYKFKNAESKVTYQNQYCGSNGTLSFILQTQGLPNKNDTIIQMGPVNVGMTFQNDKEQYYNLLFNGMSARIDQFSSYLVILRWNRYTYTSSMDVYKYVHQTGTPPYALRPEMYWFDENGQSYATEYNLDFETKEKQPCFIQAYPCLITNIKLYNQDLGTEEAIRESIKYTTQNESCVICDLARHFNAGHGYSTK